MQAAAEYVAPAPGLETELAAIFADVVGIDRISATESLFDVGGNSLIAAQVAARCGEDLDIPVAVRDIFEAPTVAALAARVGGRAPRAPAAPGRRRATGEDPALGGPAPHLADRPAGSDDADVQHPAGVAVR